MATLNLKNFPDELYEQLRLLAKRERRSISQQVIHMLAEAAQPRVQASILELRGLGKEIWRKTSAGAHVDRERESWD